MYVRAKFPEDCTKLDHFFCVRYYQHWVCIKENKKILNDNGQ